MLKIFEVIKNNFFIGTYQIASWTWSEKRTFGFVASMIKFLQSVYYAYASIIYKTNFRNIGEQNAYMFNFDLQKHDFIYIIIKVIIQPYPPQRLGEEGLV